MLQKCSAFFLIYKFGGEWAEHVEQLLNVEDVREVKINEIGDWGMTVSGELNERAQSIKEVTEAVNEMKSGKAPFLH